MTDIIYTRKGDNEMVHDHIERITHLESIQKIHGSTIATLSTSLLQMTNDFKQLKYGIFGAIILFVVQEMGIIGALKLLL